jgi:hypothetical protein
MAISVEQLQKKWWYRLVQVVYTIFVSGLIFIGAGLVYIHLPYIDTEKSTYRIVCDNGQRRGVIEGRYIDHTMDDYVTYFYGQTTRFACDNPNVPEKQFDEVFEQKEKMGEIPYEVNFKFDIEDRVYVGSWWTPFNTLFISLVIILAISLLIRAIFLYVVTGAPFVRTFFLKDKMNL